MSDISSLQTSTGVELIFKTLTLDNLRCPENLFDPRVFNPADPISTHLPLLVFKDGDHYTVLDGCKRLQYLKIQGRKDAMCGILNTEIHSNVLMQRIFYNVGRKLHFREKLQFISWLRNNTETNEYLRISQMLGIDNRERFELEGAAECSDEIIDSIVDGFLDCTMALEVNKLPGTDKFFFLNLFKKLLFSRQYQRELVEWLTEISFQKKCPVPDIFIDLDLQALLNNDKINAPQKIKKIRDYIFSVRYPNLTLTRTAWSRKINEINPDQTRVHFQASDYFEKDRLEVRITLTDHLDAVRIFNKLGQFSVEDWEAIICPGRFY